MAKGSDNPFPSVLFVEGSAPSSPAATNFRLYYDSADHLLKWKNSAGTVSTILTGTPTIVGCFVSANADQTLTNSNFTVITYNIETGLGYDSSGFHDNVTNNSRITIPATLGGYYEFKARVKFTADAGTERYIELYKNGTTRLIGADGPTDAATPNLVQLATEPIALVAGDYVEIRAYEDSAGTIKSLTGTAPVSPTFSCRLVGV